ncbi:MAG: hypothetical protein IPL84_16070 [Chitinophagaceae bacterium]|nr:hypothetical protein [Chitinophagaceae bacterium]
MKAIKQLTWISIISLCIAACKNSDTVQGSSLKGQDANNYLIAKATEKYWQLETGHDYNAYLTFKANNNIATPMGTLMTYNVDGDKLTIKDYKEYVYSIYEVGNGKLVMGLPGKDTLTYLFYEPGSDAFKKRNEEYPNFEVKAKWLKGKRYGTTWRFSEGGKVYSYMDNGTVIDAENGKKVVDWKIEGSTLSFGANKLQIKKDYRRFSLIMMRLEYL